MCHTKGNWIAKGNETNRVTFVECDGKRICTMKECEEDWDNAKLIASAPELLEALISVQNQIEHTGFFRRTGLHNLIIDAINKATEK